MRSLPESVQVATPCLPGHGDAGRLRPSTPAQFIDGVADQLDEVAEATARVLCGYSMGARAALQLFSRKPARWTHLVLVSSGPGIASAADRAVRAEADDRIVAMLEQAGAEEFTSFWNSQEIWSGDPEAVADARARMASAQDPRGLAAALKSFGQGSAPCFRGLSEQTNRPACAVVRGDRDKRYRGPCAALAAMLGVEPVVIPGGHSLPLENPSDLAGVLLELTG